MSAALLTKRQAILPGSLQLSPKRRCKIRHFCLQISGICTCKKQQFQYILLLLRCWHHKELFVDDEQNRICILLQHLHVGAFIPCHSEIDQKVRETNIFGFVVLLAGFHTEGTGHVGFTASSCSSNKDVPVFCNVFTGCQTINQCFVQFSPRMIINCCNARIWLLKFSLFRRLFLRLLYSTSTSIPNRSSNGTLGGGQVHK